MQIMYAHVMRPETLPDSYNEFILKSGPIARPVLKAVRESCRGGGIDVVSLAAYVTSKSGRPYTGVHTHSPIIPCSSVHPDMASCLAHNSRATRDTFKKTFPLYLSLTFVPFVVLNIQKVNSRMWTARFLSSHSVHDHHRTWLSVMDICALVIYVMWIAFPLLILFHQNPSILIVYEGFLWPVQYLCSLWRLRSIRSGMLWKVLFVQHVFCLHLLVFTR